MRRIAVKIAYIGNEFSGSQIQPDLRTVEGEIIRDLITLGADEKEIDLKCASRTDKGVNALGNVIVFNTRFDDDAVLLKALNAVSYGVFYRSSAEVDANFNPRHADERIYRYILPAAGIDIERAKQCASLFEGTHDLVRFCKADDRGTILNIRSVRLDKIDDVIVIEFRAEYFLWNLIRRITAAIASTGRGDTSPNDVERALNGEPISFGIARPDALTLMDIIYEKIDFITPSADMFDLRISEESFDRTLRKAFFDML
jgi:tRNA pseudouridine38-40 synthase